MDDYETIVKAERARRVNRWESAQSLLLLKAMATIQHGGGRKVAPDSDEYRALLAWIEQGVRYDDPSLPRLESLTFGSAEATLAKRAQQAVTLKAVFSDGSQKDVTRLAAFRSSDLGVAAVDGSGKLTAADFGMCTIVGQYARHCAAVQIVVPQPLEDPFPAFEPAGKIDELVLANLRKLGLPPAGPCNDEVFLRRVFLDVTGTLPSPEEARALRPIVTGRSSCSAASAVAPCDQPSACTVAIPQTAPDNGNRTSGFPVEGDAIVIRRGQSRCDIVTLSIILSATVASAVDYGSFKTDAEADKWLKDQSGAYATLIEGIEGRTDLRGYRFVTKEDVRRGMVAWSDRYLEIQLNPKLSGADRITTLIFEIANASRFQDHQQIDLAADQGLIRTPEEFGLAHEMIEFEALRLHREVLIEIAATAGPLPTEFFYFVTPTPCCIASYQLPDLYQYLKSQKESGHTEHYYKLFERRRQAAVHRPVKADKAGSKSPSSDRKPARATASSSMPDRS